jgi:hypothetical protein
MRDVFSWFNDQILRMEWLSDLVGTMLTAIGIDPLGRWGGSLHFFAYDVIKILILLGSMIFVLSYVQSYFPPERSRAILGGRRGLGALTLAALLGTVTPFCSCSSIPLFIGFVAAGLPLGVTFAFLISSPLVDLASVILLAGIIGWPAALAYVVLGVVLAVAGGALIGAIHMESEVEPFVYAAPVHNGDPGAPLTRRMRLAYAREQLVDIVGRVWPYVLIGVAVGALIHNWIPQALIDGVLGQDKWWAVPLAVVAGVPVYADIFGTLPVAEALVGKGVGTGTVLAFMMAVTALSLPSLILLRRVVRMRLLTLFVAIVTVGIILTGYVFNALIPLLMA